MSLSSSSSSPTTTTSSSAPHIAEGKSQQIVPHQQQHHHSALRGNTLLFAADYLSSWAATTFSIFFSHPFDTARIRRQTHRVALVQEQRQHVFQASTIDRYLSANALKQRGRHVRSLYDGFFTPITTTGPVIAVSFALNELFQRTVSWACFGDWDADAHKKKGDFRFHHFAAAGSLAGGTAALVQTPVAVIRISQQVHNTHAAELQLRPQYAQAPTTSSNAAISAAHKITPVTRASVPMIIRKVFTEDGFRGFYRGLPLEAVNASASRLIYFSVWEELRVAIPKWVEEQKAIREKPLMAPASKSSSSSSPAKKEKKQRPPLWTQALAATLASWSGWLAIYPLDAIKSRVQSGVGSGKRPPGAGNNAGAAASGKMMSSARAAMDGVSPGNAAEAAGAGTAAAKNKKPGFIQVAIDVYRHHGLSKGMYSGLGMTLARGVVSSGISLPLYDYLKPQSRKLLLGEEEAFD